MFNDINALVEFIQNQRRNEKKESLSYMRKLCMIFGNPENKSNFIHIGGTNGKGSTISFLKHILLEAGYKVGSFTSPYIIKFNERITLNDKYISDEDLLKYGNYILSRYEDLEKHNMRQPGFFEFLTLLMFLYFADQNVDLVICEVGIGGKLDSTNVITPLISAVTNVSYDHIQMLGDTLSQIWDNKLGIIKNNIPFITFKNSEFNDKIINKAEEENSPLLLIEEETIKDIEVKLEYTKFTYQDFENVNLQLLGKHQTLNAVLAIEIARNIKGHPVSHKSIYEGLQKANLPGRLEIVNNNPLIILDGAHNIGGIGKLANFILNLKNNYIRLVFAVSSNKEKDKMISFLENYVDEVIFTQFHNQRSVDSEYLFSLSKHENKKIINDLNKIINLSLENKETITIFCGSLYLISEIRNLIVDKKFPH